MTTVTVKGFLYIRRNCVDDKQEFSVLPYKSSYDVWGVNYGPIEFEHALPEGFNFEAEELRQRIDCLQKERAEAGAEFARKVRKIDEELSKLTAIEFSPSEVAA